MSWGATGSDELPPGMPSAIGLPEFRLKAISSAVVRGGGAGPPPVFRASAFFLLAKKKSNENKHSLNPCKACCSTRHWMLCRHLICQMFVRKPTPMICSSLTGLNYVFIFHFQLMPCSFNACRIAPTGKLSLDLINRFCRKMR